MSKIIVHLYLISKYGKVGDQYNIGGGKEISNIEKLK